VITLIAVQVVKPLQFNRVRPLVSRRYSKMTSLIVSMVSKLPELHGLGK